MQQRDRAGNTRPLPQDRGRVRRLRSQGRTRAWRLEQLESRTLLAGTPITPPQEQAILGGFLALAELGPKFDSQAALVVSPLDLLVQPAGQASQPTTRVSLGTLLPFKTL